MENNEWSKPVAISTSELVDLLMPDDGYDPLTPAEKATVAEHLQRLTGKGLQENLADALELIHDARKEGSQ